MIVIEKMARAIGSTAYNDPKAFDRVGDVKRRQWTNEARAALKALEPTDAMLEAGRAEMNNQMAIEYYGPAAPKPVFNAMIQTALEEET